MRWHDVQQNSEEWEQLRIGKVTMSNAPKFMANEGKAFGDPAKNYALQKALEILTGKRSEFGFTNGHMERGHEQEPVARMLYEEENFINVDNGGFFDCGDYGDSPDGLVSDDGIIEIKSVIPTIHYANLRRSGVDPAYKWQIIGHLDCTGREWCDFVSYCSDFPESRRLITYRINRKDVESEILSLRIRREKFICYVKEVINLIK